MVKSVGGGEVFRCECVKSLNQITTSVASLLKSMSVAGWSKERCSTALRIMGNEFRKRLKSIWSAAEGRTPQLAAWRTNPVKAKPDSRDVQGTGPRGDLDINAELNIHL